MTDEMIKMPSRDEIGSIVMDIISSLDEDIAKQFDPETSEFPDEIDDEMSGFIDMVEEWLRESR